MEAVLGRDRHLVRQGQVILGDEGLAGAAFEAFVTDGLGTHLVRPDRKGEPARFGRLARVRQWIEAVIDPEGPAQPGTGRRTNLSRRLPPTGQRLLALAAAIWHNWKTGGTIKRSLIAYDH